MEEPLIRNFMWHLTVHKICTYGQELLTIEFLQVMTVVKTLVRSGITICATIHSPTPYCFNLFDSLMILLRGNVVYFGQNGAHGCMPGTIV